MRALNLLLPPNDSRMDTDGDGIVSVGVAKKIIFPPANAPKEVDDAWNEATTGVDVATRMHMEMSMHLARHGISTDGFLNARGSAPPDIPSLRDLVARALEGMASNRRDQNADQQRFSDGVSKAMERFDKALAAREQVRKTSASGAT